MKKPMLLEPCILNITLKISLSGDFASLYKEIEISVVFCINLVVKMVQDEQDYTDGESGDEEEDEEEESDDESED